MLVPSTTLPAIPSHLPTVNEIAVEEIPPADATEKGSLTWIYPLGEIDGGSLATFVRTPHHVVGGHWHENIPNKNPERFILLHGTMIFTFEDAFGGRRVEHLETVALGKKILLTIPPYIMHWVEIRYPVALYQEIQQEPFRLTDNRALDDWFRFKEAVATLRKT